MPSGAGVSALDQQGVEVSVGVFGDGQAGGEIDEEFFAEAGAVIGGAFDDTVGGQQQSRHGGHGGHRFTPRAPSGCQSEAEPYVIAAECGPRARSVPDAGGLSPLPARRPAAGPGRDGVGAARSLQV
ncbi:hypothetical protein GCM10010166_54090 [Couchioplanes caeruleus subsp. azureus]|nr:hypothetical protein GCM10010166_54090 [Couchioplanes caeruleus subsp. azureus]